MRISLFVLFTVCMLLLTTAGPVAGYKPSAEEIAARVEPPYITITVRIDPNHMPPGPYVDPSGENIAIDPIYSPGDEIELSGENTATDMTYLFITGPGLPVNGAQIHNPDPGHSPLENGNPATFQQAAVKSDHKWS